MKKVLITGVSYGLGQSISKLLIDKGYLVYGISRTKPLKKLVENKNFAWFKADISNLNELKETYEKIDDLDILINNVGIYSNSLFENESFENIENIIDTNLKGNIYVTKLAVQKLNENSRIIFVNSIAGLNLINQESIYVATKHGLSAFASVLGSELKSRKIKVTSVYPGGINTPLQSKNPNKEELLTTEFVSNYILQIIEARNVEFKSLSFYPDIENH